MPASRRLFRDGQAVDIEAKVFDLIQLLVGNHERALDKQEIVEALWGQRPITDAALSQLIYKARRACDDNGGRQAVIRTIHGRGLQWVAPVTEAVAGGADTAVTRIPPPIAPADANAAPVRHRRVAALAVALLVLLATVAVLPWRWPPHAASLPRVALVPIENATGEASLDWTTHGLPGLLASLLDEDREFHVIDPLQVARAWEYTRAPGEDRSQHTRTATNASVIVGGALRRVAGLYELRLHVGPLGQSAGKDIILTGIEPAALAIAALPRLRAALAGSRQSATPHGAVPRDPYLAQGFARGMDSAMHGQWAAAHPYFQLVAQGEPGFLPARYRLGQAQMRTGHPETAETTLRAVLADAEGGDDPALAAWVLKELAYGAMLKHAFGDALAHIREAEPYAQQAGNPAIQADLATQAANALSRLKHNDDASRELAKARQLIERHDLPQLRKALHAAEVFAADSRSDFLALEQAARASLVASQALGDERSSTIALYNIAYAMENQGRRLQALPLWVRIRDWAHTHQDYHLEVGAAWYLASGLFNVGLVEPAERINAQVLAAARSHADRMQQSLALRFQAGSEWLRGDIEVALASCRAASALVDPDNDPSSQLNAWSAEAFVALDAEPSEVVAIARRTDTLISAQPDPSAHHLRQQWIHAARAAVEGDAAATHAALEAAREAAVDGYETTEVRQLALHIALIAHDPVSAAIGLRDGDIARLNDAMLLELAARWAAQRDDAQLAEQVVQRRQELRQAAIETLREAAIDPATVLNEITATSERRHTSH